MFASDAQSQGSFTNAGDPKEEHINERAHWSVLAKLGRPCAIYGKPDTPYDPDNLPAAFKRAGAAGVSDRIAGPTAEELKRLPREAADLAAALS